MTSGLDYWKFLAGVGLFLYGMERLEDTLKNIVGKKFKLFLKKYTSNRFLSILNGIVATSILQSSSIVLLMVIAFTGVGILSLSNSLGIILGANLGTTMTGWLVSTLGFGTNIETFIFPMFAIGSLGLIFIHRRYSFHQIFGLFVAVGLLLMGLEFMKASMHQLSTAIDVKEISKYGNWAFFMFGFVVTAIIQSSSAMMTITLSALYATIITLEPAAYIAIGADLGTTITALIASFNGTAVKKRVGLAHFFFNIGTAGLALLTVLPTLNILQNNFHFSNPLLTLVAFHSIFNLLGIIIFFPFLGLFEKFLNRLFVDKNHACTIVHKVSTEIPEASLVAIRLELNQLLKKVFNFNLNILGLSRKFSQSYLKQDNSFFGDLLTTNDNDTEYTTIKNIEDELLSYLANLQRKELEDPESTELRNYILSLRNAVHSAKSLKDIDHNFKEIGQSIISEEEEFIRSIHESYSPVFELINEELRNENQDPCSEGSIDAFIKNETAYQTINHWVYQEVLQRKNSTIKAATLLNMNREISTANQHFIEALKDLQRKNIKIS